MQRMIDESEYNEEVEKLAQTLFDEYKKNPNNKSIIENTVNKIKENSLFYNAKEENELTTESIQQILADIADKTSILFEEAIKKDPSLRSRNDIKLFTLVGEIRGWGTERKVDHDKAKAIEAELSKGLRGSEAQGALRLAKDKQRDETKPTFFVPTNTKINSNPESMGKEKEKIPYKQESMDDIKERFLNKAYEIAKNPRWANASLLPNEQKSIYKVLEVLKAWREQPKGTDAALKSIQEIEFFSDGSDKLQERYFRVIKNKDANFEELRKIETDLFKINLGHSAGEKVEGPQANSLIQTQSKFRR